MRALSSFQPKPCCGCMFGVMFGVAGCQAMPLSWELWAAPCAPVCQAPKQRQPEYLLLAGAPCLPQLSLSVEKEDPSEEQETEE